MKKNIKKTNQNTLEKLEDIILDKIAAKREKTFKREEALSHKEIWENVI